MSQTNNRTVQSKNRIVSQFKTLDRQGLYRLTQTQSKNRIVQSKNRTVRNKNRIVKSKNRIVSLLSHCFNLINPNRKNFKEL